MRARYNVSHCTIYVALHKEQEKIEVCDDFVAASDFLRILGRELINPPLDECRESALKPEPAIAS
jgi:hypothetical protein